MKNKFNTKLFIITLFMCTALLCMFTSDINAGPNPGGEPPENATERIVGPAIEAVLTGQLMDEGVAQIVVVGACKQDLREPNNGNKLSVSFTLEILTTPANFANSDETFVENQRVEDAPAGCFSIEGGEELIVTNVTKYNNTGSEIGADVSISAIELK